MADNKEIMLFEDEEEDYLNDPDYVPEAELADGESSESGEDDEDEGECEEDDEEDNKYKDPDYVPEEESDDSNSEYESDDESVQDNEPVQAIEAVQAIANAEPVENAIIDCEGCDFEWKDGWQNGWKAAMKYIRKQTNIQIPAPPTCDNCGILAKTRKCGGNCGGVTQYCSVKCQVSHWKTEHKHLCSK